MEHSQMMEVLKEKLEQAKKYVLAGDDYFSKDVQALTLALEKLEKIKENKLDWWYSRTQELEAELALLKGKIDSLKKVLDSPERWMKWCDIKVLEENEELKKELALLKKKVDIKDLFPVIKSEISHCICRAVNFVEAKIPETPLNMLSNESTDRVIEAIVNKLSEEVKGG